MTVCVTGAFGFVGSHLVRRLLGKGCDVLAVDDLSRGKKRNLVGVNCKTLIGDLSDRNTQNRLIDRLYDSKVDVLVHLASPMSHNPMDHLRGMEMTAGYLRMLEQTKIPTVFMSTSAANVLDYDEHTSRSIGLYNQPVQPEGLYGMTKIFTEWALASLYEKGLISPYIALRPSNIYGPREIFSGHPHIHVIPSIIRKAMLGISPIEVLGDGTQTRPFTYVDDVVDALISAMHTVVYDVVADIEFVHGPSVSIRDVTRLILDATGSKVEIEYKHDSAIGVQSRVLPPSDYQTKWNIKDGINETVKWVKENQYVLSE